MKKPCRQIFILLLLQLAFIHAEQKPFTITTSFSILKDFVKQISRGANNIRIHSVIPYNVDPHCHQLIPNDLKIIEKSDVIFINGLSLERCNERMLTELRLENKTFVLSSFLNKEIRKNPLDPHVWLDASYALSYIKKMVEVLCQKNPENASIYSENGKNLEKKIAKLDNWIKKQFDKIPLSKRFVVLTHDSLWYYGK
ncbi:MAG: metal ABC transporter solute-binding protein, Zn/Mn family [Alphaproteobacteria bacterium]